MALEEDIKPDAVLTSSNFTTPLVELIDDDVDAPSGDYLDPIVLTADAEARVSFASPTRSLQAGTNLQAIRVLATAGGTTPSVTLTLELWENDVYLGQSAFFSWSVGTFIHTLFWSKSLLTDPTGAGVECRFICDNNATNYIRIDALEWLARLVVAPSLVSIPVSVPTIKAHGIKSVGAINVPVSAPSASMKRGTSRWFVPGSAGALVDVTTYSVRVNRKVPLTPASFLPSAPNSLVYTLAKLLPQTITVFAIPGRLWRRYLPVPTRMEVTVPEHRLRIGRLFTPASAVMTISAPTVASETMFGVETRASRQVLTVKKGDKLNLRMLKLSGADTIKTIKEGSSVSLVLYEDPR